MADSDPREVFLRAAPPRVGASMIAFKSSSVVLHPHGAQTADMSPERLVVVEAIGDSMRPVFNPNDPLLVDLSVRQFGGDAIYFFRVGAHTFVKHLQSIPGEGIRVISANSAYERWTTRKGMDFEVLGRVVKVWCSQEF